MNVINDSFTGFNIAGSAPAWGEVPSKMGAISHVISLGEVIHQMESTGKMLGLRDVTYIDSGYTPLLLLSLVAVAASFFIDNEAHPLFQSTINHIQKTVASLGYLSALTHSIALIALGNPVTGSVSLGFMIYNLLNQKEYIGDNLGRGVTLAVSSASLVYGMHQGKFFDALGGLVGLVCAVADLMYEEPEDQLLEGTPAEVQNPTQLISRIEDIRSHTCSFDTTYFMCETDTVYETIPLEITKSMLESTVKAREEAIKKLDMPYLEQRLLPLRARKEKKPDYLIGKAAKLLNNCFLEKNKKAIEQLHWRACKIFGERLKEDTALQAQVKQFLETEILLTIETEKSALQNIHEGLNAQGKERRKAQFLAGAYVLARMGILY